MAAEHGALSAELRQLRRSRGWTQEEAAGQAGVEQTQISTWERGKVKPSPEMLQRLAVAFKVPYEHLARLANYLPPEAPTSDVFDRAPLARLLATLEALPGFAAQLDQLDALSEDRQEHMIRRLARRFAFEFAEELAAAEHDTLANHRN